MNSQIQYETKQVVDSLKYVEMSLETVKNTLENINNQTCEPSVNKESLDSNLLLKRVKDGGHSGEFLAHAFISSYQLQTPFQHSLGEIIKLDVEAIQLFHQIVNIRFIKGWSDSALYELEQKIIELNEVAK